MKDQSILYENKKRSLLFIDPDGKRFFSDGITIRKKEIQSENFLKMIQVYTDIG